MFIEAWCILCGPKRNGEKQVTAILHGKQQHNTRIYEDMKEDILYVLKALRHSGEFLSFKSKSNQEKIHV